MRYYALIYNIFYINKIEIFSPLFIKHTIIHWSSILRPQHQSRGILLSKWLVPHVSKTGSHPFWAVADTHGNRTDTGEKKGKKTWHDKVFWIGCKPSFHDDEIVDTFWLLDTLWKHGKDLGPDWPCHQCFCWYNCGSILHETSMFSARFHWSHQPIPPVLFLPIMLHPWNSIISSFCSL